MVLLFFPPYLSFLERASVSLLTLSAKQGSYWYHFLMSFEWRGPWLGIEPGTSRPQSQHSTTRQSRRQCEQIHWASSIIKFNPQTVKRESVKNPSTFTSPNLHLPSDVFLYLWADVYSNLGWCLWRFPVEISLRTYEQLHTHLDPSHLTSVPTLAVSSSVNVPWNKIIC